MIESPFWHRVILLTMRISLFLAVVIAQHVAGSNTSWRKALGWQKSKSGSTSNAREAERLGSSGYQEPSEAAHGTDHPEEPLHGWQDWENWGPTELYQPVEHFHRTGIGSSGYRLAPYAEASSTNRIEVQHNNIRSEYDAGEMNRSFGSDFRINDEHGSSQHLYEANADEATSTDWQAQITSEYDDMEEGEIAESQSEDSSDDDEDVEPQGRRQLAAWVIKRKAQARLRKLLDQNWAKYDLGFDMDPRDLAFAVVRIKMDLQGEDIDGIGMTASNKVKEKKDEDYRETYQLYAKRYNKKYKTVLKEVNSNVKYTTDEERRQAILSAISKYQTRQYDQRLLFDSTSRKADMAADHRAKEVWAAFLAHLNKKWRTKVDPKTLTIAIVEEETRGLSLAGFSPLRTQESIKRYLIRYHGKNGGDIDRFCILRRQYRVKCTLEQKQKKNVERRKELGMRPPLRRHKAPQK